jgi:hypothetical protein
MFRPLESDFTAAHQTSEDTMNPSPQNGERDPRESGGFSFPSFPAFILIAFIGAIVFNMLFYRREAPAPRPEEDRRSIVFDQGEWLTTPEGGRVCRVAYTIYLFSTLNEGFCVDWQPGFEPLKRGMVLTGREGYTRPNPSGGHAQFHTEKGWKP